MRYLAYDLKGIQSYIFAVPRLRHIVGGSALIDRFDRETAPAIACDLGQRLVFSGGGRGLFRIDGDEEALRRRVIAAAHGIGADVAIGIAGDPITAITDADRHYSFVPEALDGHPCPDSGLFPSPKGSPHPVIAARVDPAVRFRVEDELLQHLQLPPELRGASFFRDSEERATQEALGSRGRWAVIVMDGNDMGRQFRIANDRLQERHEALCEWLAASSAALDCASRHACAAAAQAVIDAWCAALRREGKRPGRCLPLRPLVVGGDDIIILCHVSHAFTFVRRACEEFARQAALEAQAWGRQHGIDLWPATAGRLTISAGVLFCPMKLPLATAITFCESLLASAKGLGRKRQVEGEPAPACVDWEQVTEGMLETPAARRQRELRFLDRSTKPESIVELTCRPYTLDGLAELQQRAERYRPVPATIRHQVLPSLRAVHEERLLWWARLDKRKQQWRDLIADLEEGDGLHDCGRWRVDHATVDGRSLPRRRTDVVDALLLLEEEERMQWITRDEE